MLAHFKMEVLLGRLANQLSTKEHKIVDHPELDTNTKGQILKVASFVLGNLKEELPNLLVSQVVQTSQTLPSYRICQPQLPYSHLFQPYNMDIGT